LADKARVLVVEDERALLRAMQRILSHFDVTPATTIAEARRALTTGFFDVVVCDVHLPDGNGFVLRGDVLSANPDQGMRFVFATAAADDPNVRRILEATGAPYLCKPFVVRTFLEIVTCLSEGRQPRRTSSARRLWVAHP
jgi:DNA-binding response OmpR family regulator